MRDGRRRPRRPRSARRTSPGRRCWAREPATVAVAAGRRGRVGRLHGAAGERRADPSVRPAGGAGRRADDEDDDEELRRGRRRLDRGGPRRVRGGRPRGLRVRPPAGPSPLGHAPRVRGADRLGRRDLSRHHPHRVPGDRHRRSGPSGRASSRCTRTASGSASVARTTRAPSRPARGTSCGRCSGSLPSLVVAGSVVVILLGVSGWLIGEGHWTISGSPSGQEPQGTTATLLVAAILMVGVCLIWWGPLSRMTRLGARRVLAVVAPGRKGALDRDRRAARRLGDLRHTHPHRHRHHLGPAAGADAALTRIPRDARPRAVRPRVRAKSRHAGPPWRASPPPPWVRP